MSNEKYLKRVCFKLSIKDKWLSTYWTNSNINELPYTLKGYMENIIQMFNEDTIYFKIERKLKEEGK